MKLPGLERRAIAEAKLVHYLLDVAHPDVGSKARFFLRFNLGSDHPDVLRRVLMQHPLDHDVHSEQSSPYGERFVIRCSAPMPDGRAPCIRTVWELGSDGTPRFVTAFPD